jgi:hypothetical protein
LTFSKKKCYSIACYGRRPINRFCKGGTKKKEEEKREREREQRRVTESAMRRKAEENNIIRREDSIPPMGSPLRNPPLSPTTRIEKIKLPDLRESKNPQPEIPKPLKP